MRNSLANRVRYALQQGNVVDLDARGFVTVTSNSDSTPTVVNYAKMFGNKIALDVDFGDDEDIVAITPPFGFIVNYTKVQTNTSVSNGKITLKRNASVISDVMSCDVDKTLTEIGTIDNAYSTLATTDVLTVTNVSAGVKAVTTLDILPL